MNHKILLGDRQNFQLWEASFLSKTTHLHVSLSNLSYIRVVPLESKLMILMVNKVTPCGCCRGLRFLLRYVVITALINNIISCTENM